jgi:hypothetical protein
MYKSMQKLRDQPETARAGIKWTFAEAPASRLPMHREDRRRRSRINETS